MMFSGWGRFPVHASIPLAPRTQNELRTCLKRHRVIARGNGRAYGDSAIGADATIQMHHFNHMLDFDPDTGVLVAEAGVLLADIIASFLARGWFPPVTPGTKFVTLGGMIAADVHGKNHHKDGSFGGFIDWIDLMDATGTVHRCSPHQNTQMFNWTVGGMGLTGVILRAALRLRPVQSAWIKQTTQALPNLDAALAAFEAAGGATYSVAWIDCLSKGPALGRSILMLGEHAAPADLRDDAARYPFETPAKPTRSVPFSAPSGMLNRFTVRAFNALYYWQNARNAGTSLVDWDSYFYPLDAILGWNRIYGRKGFMQFQCVLPLETSSAGLKALLEATSRAGAGSFLAVLKRLGPQDSPFSFPMEGYTLALDFPVTPQTTALMAKLDQITLRHGGRFYLAKDARMSAQTLRQSDPRVPDFVAMRDKQGLKQPLQSKQSERLQL
jgi:FAD/FMN-containing dehydrogenase